MNGQNNQLSAFFKKYWRFIFYCGSGIYIFIVVALGIFIINIPWLYNQGEVKYVNETKNALESALNESDRMQMQKDLEQVTNDFNLDLVVKENGDVVFATTPEHDFEALRDSANEIRLSYHSAYEYTVNGQTFQIWVAVYKVSAQSFFEMAMGILLASIVILGLVMTGLVLILYQQLIMPIRRLQRNILNLREFRFGEVENKKQSGEYDVLSDELSEFSEELQEKMDTIDTNYTRLERDLQEEQERSIYRQQLVTAVVHDLKTPINVATLRAEILEQAIAEGKPTEQLFADIYAADQLLLEQVNEVLKIMNSDHEQNDQLQKVEVVKVAKEVMLLFTSLFEKRNITAELDVPETLMAIFRPFEIKQILHNVISNACQYTDIGGEFTLNIEQDSNQLIINAYNDKASTDEIDFKHVFDLFYHVNGVDNKYSSGIGMYTIKKMVESYRGTCEFVPHEDGVLLTIALPLDGGGRDA